MIPSSKIPISSGRRCLIERLDNEGLRGGILINLVSTFDHGRPLVFGHASLVYVSCLKINRAVFRILKLKRGRRFRPKDNALLHDAHGHKTGARTVNRKDLKKSINWNGALTGDAMGEKGNSACKSTEGRKTRLLGYVGNSSERL